MFAVEWMSEEAYMADLRTRFDLLVQLHFHLDEERKKIPSGELFTAILEGVRYALKVEVELGSLAAVDALNAVRTNILRDEIRAISKSITALRRETRTSLEGVLQFEDKFRNVMNARHGVIVPPHLSGAQKVKLDDLYVSPSFVEPTEPEGRVVEALGIPEMLGRMHRTVILGNPGGGKSTLATKLCFNLSKAPDATSCGERAPTPILVVLREYVAEKTNRQLSILQYISENARSSYQTDPPSGAFEYLLLNGRAIVIFDGLDELLETNQRQKVSAQVESFCHLYPATPVIVTSREVGYEQAPLDPGAFEIFKLAPFTEAQAQEYVSKWFMLEEEARPEHARRKITAFWTESASVPDLRSNPLMLGLMCTIYRAENYIPINRPDVYRKCAEMMFDKWDRKREIPVRFRFESDFRPPLAYLAYWIYSNETLQTGVTEDQLILKAVDYLAPKRFEDRDEAEAYARDFVEYCRGRAWVFTNTGSNGQGVELYQFTHRTFLEYFAALYLNRTHETADALAEVLLPKLARREWDMVSQLAFQIKNSEAEGGGDRLLARVLAETQKDSDVESWSLLSFAARCLEFLVPSPPTTRAIAKYSAERVITQLATNSEFLTPNANSEVESENKLILDILMGLIWVAPENRPGVSAGLKEAILEANTLDDDQMIIASFEVGLPMGMVLRPHLQSGIPSSGPAEHFVNFSEQVANTYEQQIVRLSQSDFNTAYDACLRGQITPEQMNRWQGGRSFSRQRHYRAYGSGRVSLTALAALWALSSVHGSGYLDGVMRGILRIMEQVISEYSLWGITHFGVILTWAGGMKWRSPHPIRSDLSGEELYGLFLVLAYEIENPDVRREAQRCWEVAAWRGVPFGNLIESRMNGGAVTLDERLPLLWNAEQIATAVNWATQDINFARPGSGR
jgi:hypothetical protein